MSGSTEKKNVTGNAKGTGDVGKKMLGEICPERGGADTECVSVFSAFVRLHALCSLYYLIFSTSRLGHDLRSASSLNVYLVPL